MKKLSLLLLLVCTIGQAQVENTIKTDITKLTEIINSKNAQAFYDFLCGAIDIKKILARSNETDFKRIQSRYAGHFEITPKQLFDFLNKKFSKYPKRSGLKPYVAMYKTAAMNAEKKAVIDIFFKDNNNTLFSLELYVKKFGTDVCYSFKKEIEILPKKNVEQFNSKIKPLLANNTSEFTIISFDKDASSSTENVTYAYTDVDEKPVIENNVQLTDIIKKIRTDVTAAIETSEEDRAALKGKHRCTIRLTVTKDKKLRYMIRATSGTLNRYLRKTLKKQKVTQPGKKDGVPVDTVISFPLLLTIN